MGGPGSGPRKGQGRSAKSRASAFERALRSAQSSPKPKAMSGAAALKKMQDIFGKKK